MATLTITLLILGAIGVGLFLLLKRVSAPGTVIQCDPNWITEFSVTKYRPMLRLLAEEDYDFLKSQPGFNGKMLRKLRSQRRDIFRGYLKSLVRDFHRLHMAARESLLYGTADCSELATLLIRQKATFTLAVFQVQFRLLVHAAGVGTVDVHKLIEALDSMRLNVGGTSLEGVAA